MFTAVGNLVSVAVESSVTFERLKMYPRGDRYYVLGEPGKRFQISVEPLTEEPIEVVISVDGLGIYTLTQASIADRGAFLFPGDEADRGCCARGRTVKFGGYQAGPLLYQAFAFGGSGLPLRFFHHDYPSGLIAIAVFCVRHKLALRSVYLLSSYVERRAMTERVTQLPAETFEIRYEDLRSLLALGIDVDRPLVSSRDLAKREQALAFPADSAVSTAA